MTEAAASPVAAVVIIGNEILSGRTRDANLSYLARKLGDAGIPVREARIVGDEAGAIVAAVNELRTRFTHVFTTGGIGPTHDDITARTVARAFGVAFERHREAERRLRSYYEPEKINEARLSMADMPVGVELIDNPVSVAPGFRLDNVYVLPGVPKILEAMVDELIPRLVGGRPLVSRALTVFCAEGELADPLATLQARFAGVDIGSYPFFRHGRFGTTVVVRGADADEVATALLELRALADGRSLEHAAFDAASESSEAGLPRAE